MLYSLNRPPTWSDPSGQGSRHPQQAAAGDRKVKRHGNAHQSELAEANQRATLWSELKVSLLRYALALLSPKKYGCTTTMLSARGVKIEMINELIGDGLATASTERVGNARSKSGA